MTIDEYLNQLKTLKERKDFLFKKVDVLLSKATSPGPALKIGMPHSQTNTNHTEDSIIDYASLSQELKSTQNEYNELSNTINRTINYLLYWEGCVITRVYFYNIYLGYDDLHGLNEILKTNDKNEILAKLDQAKTHLAKLLQSRGIEIE